jgi:glycosyltransferase involved in cell wall biosynthesis
MKIGIIYDDISREGLDCSQPNKGNPGVGGTQYCYLMFLYYYAQYFTNDSIVVYRHRNANILPRMPREDIIKYVETSNIRECVEKAAGDDVDFLLFTHGHLLEITEYLETYNIRGVVWVHNWIRGEYLKKIVQSQMIVRVVFLGQEHYDRYVDHEITKKAVVIPNMFNTEGYPARSSIVNHNVTYVGAIVPGKGFHALAEAWPRVIDEIPDANLYVIGKGNLYGKGMEPGPLGIADSKYENQFYRHITNTEGGVIPSVHFLGILGSEKIDYYLKTSVGIVNPTGVTEVCPISALEMEAAGIPVISRKINGLPDVIIDGCTGILIRNQKQLAQSIIDLLIDLEKNETMGMKGREFVQEMFSPIKIINLWNDMFLDIMGNRAPDLLKPHNNFGNNFKWIRIVNSQIKTVPIFKHLPALIDIEGMMRGIVRR